MALKKGTPVNYLVDQLLFAPVSVNVVKEKTLFNSVVEKFF